MRGAIAITVLLTGCDLLFGIDHVRERDAAVADAVPVCLGSGLLNICSEATGAIELKTPINTTIDGRCRKVAQDNGPPLCVIDGTEIKVSEYVSVTGASPLVLLATKSVEIAAVLDASSKTTTLIGAAAQSGCPSSPGANGTSGAGGGGGGTFGFLGGPGGNGQMATVPTGGGAPSAVVPQLAIYGGCAGGAGGIVVGTPASGAAGGGAIYIIAAETIHVTTSGSINASGGGGAGAQMRGGGGGGGGSGGFIALDAPTVHVEGPVFARGGGGGGGGGSTTAGGAGTDPLATASASGGAPGIGGGAGGDGCGQPDGMQGGLASAAVYGGGGGGGACGRIRLYGTRSGSGVVNPTPS